jgi:hypothetical protein
VSLTISTNFLTSRLSFLSFLSSISYIFEKTALFFLFVEMLKNLAYADENVYRVSKII